MMLDDDGVAWPPPDDNPDVDPDQPWPRMWKAGVPVTTFLLTEQVGEWYPNQNKES